MITVEYVQTHFPLWNKFILDDNGHPSQTILQEEINLASQEFTEYLERTAQTITSAEKIHLLNIVRYRAFNRLHGDTAFETKPQIVRDYENTVQALKKKGGVTDVTSNEKKFASGKWFNESEV